MHDIFRPDNGKFYLIGICNKKQVIIGSQYWLKKIDTLHP